MIEDTYDWYAQDDNGNVWYLGEDVTNFEYDEQGNLISSDKHGSWEAGVDGGVAGTIMEAEPRVGYRYYQEFRPGVVLDQGEVLATDETITVPAGAFTDVVRTKDTTVVEPLGLAHKFYAPGVGLTKELKFDLLTDEVLATFRLLSVELNGQIVTELVPTSGFQGTNPGGEAKDGIEFGDDATLRAHGQILLNGVEFEGEASITSRAEVSVVDAVFSDESWICAKDTVSFREVFAEDEVHIRGDVDVYIFGSEFMDEVEIRLGAGDNSLVIEDSQFDELSARGGHGTNTFEDRGGNVFDELELKRFMTA